MKTTCNKNTVKKARQQISDLSLQLQRLRRDKRAMIAGMKAEEEAILSRMFTVIPDLTEKLSRFPTAAEITRAMGGDMTQHEVVGNLLVALNDHYNGFSYPNPTKKASHKAVECRKGKVAREYITITQRFAEVDEDGKLIEGGVTMKKDKHTTSYGVMGK